VTEEPMTEGELDWLLRSAGRTEALGSEWSVSIPATFARRLVTELRSLRVKLEEINSDALDGALYD